MPFVGLIIRGKHTESHEPGLMSQHADVILSTGAPRGFFGEGDPASGLPGMMMDGRVYDYSEMTRKRPYYVNLEEAKMRRVISTVCSLHVSEDVARRFDDFWKKLQGNTKAQKESFSLLGDNCSTHASQGFVASGILRSSIPGLDTPDNLFQQLKQRYGSAFRCASGYIGFERNGQNFKINVEPQS